MSIELCNLYGYEAASVILDKIAQPDTALTLGGVALDRIVEVRHYDDGVIVINFRSSEDNEVTFQFNPNDQPVYETVMGNDGQNLCVDCEAQ